MIIKLVHLQLMMILLLLLSLLLLPPLLACSRVELPIKSTLPSAQQIAGNFTVHHYTRTHTYYIQRIQLLSFTHSTLLVLYVVLPLCALCWLYLSVPCNCPSYNHIIWAIKCFVLSQVISVSTIEIQKPAKADRTDSEVVSNCWESRVWQGAVFSFGVAVSWLKLQENYSKQLI